ncbi:general transcription and DNA repair factor IIH subunit TFB2-like [Coffea arabica]|uniref:General transcription and DNA repair factor IIH subunit TFB2-like n=1 Tax=Coffea arabica TaxID=13443 RepID=A0ABM4W6A3_COFAR
MATSTAAYNINTLSDIQRTIIRDLADLDLVKLQQFLIVFWLFIREERRVGLSPQSWLQIYLSQLIRYIIQETECTSSSCKKNSSASVPENATDQIRLWESDLNRVERIPAHFFEEFPSTSREVFEAACDHARECGGFLWENSKKNVTCSESRKFFLHEGVSSRKEAIVFWHLP